MNVWFELMKPNYEQLSEFLYENLNELENVYHLGWEEANNDLSDFFGIDGANKINNLMIDLSNKANRKIKFYNVTCSSKNFPINKYQGEGLSHIEVVYFPTYLFFRTMFRCGPQEVIKPPFTGAIENNYETNRDIASADICDLYTQTYERDFKYLYLYMTHHPKRHRCMLMDILYKHDFHQYGALSWREFHKGLDRTNLTTLDSIADNVVWKYWTPRRLYLDQYTDTPGPLKWDLLPKEFNESFVQLIGESLEDGVFATEKTAVPLIYNKPFLIMGGKDSHKHVKSLGFVEYDELFDYGFDNCSDMCERAEGIVENLKSLQSKVKSVGYKKLLNSVRDKLIYNKKHAHTVILDSVPEEIRKFIKGNNLAFFKNLQWIPFNECIPYFDYCEKFQSRFL